MSDLKSVVKKSFEPEDELKILDYWKRENVFRSFDSSLDWFSIDIPPPYATGSMHVGGSAHYVQIDMVARYFRMNGTGVNQASTDFKRRMLEPCAIQKVISCGSKMLMRSFTRMTTIRSR